MDLSDSLKKKRGSILPMVLGIGLLLQILSFGVEFFISDVYKNRRVIDLKKESEYSARGAIESILFGLRNKSSDSIEGIVDLSGNSAGFTVDSDSTSQSIRYFDLENMTYSDQLDPTKNSKHQAKIIVSEVGTTRDGLRKRYKVVAEVSYR